VNGMKLGQRLAKRRREVFPALTQTQVAEMLRIGQPELSMIEGGQRAVPREIAARIANLYRLDRDDLLVRCGHLPDDLPDLFAQRPILLRLLRHMTCLPPSALRRLEERLRP